MANTLRGGQFDANSFNIKKTHPLDLHVNADKKLLGKFDVAKRCNNIISVSKFSAEAA